MLSSKHHQAFAGYCSPVQAADYMMDHSGDNLDLDECNTKIANEFCKAMKLDGGPQAMLRLACSMLNVNCNLTASTFSLTADNGIVMQDMFDKGQCDMAKRAIDEYRYEA